MSSVLPKNLQSVVVNDMTTSTSIVTPLISTSNLITSHATIPTIMMTGSLHATHTNNTIANIFTTNGNVGIGTTAPNSRLEVNGTIKSGDITVGNINFTGSLYQNGLAYLGSQWTTTSGNTITYTSGNVIVNSGLTSSFNSNTIGSLVTTGGNIGINTTSPGTRLDVSGTGRITTSLTTGTLYSTNQTTTNIVSTSLSTGTLNTSTMSTAILTASTSITTGALFSTNQTTTNIVGTNLTMSSIIVTSGTLSATFNSNTLGNIFTTGGNVGVGTSPAQQLHVNTSLAVNNLTFLGNPTSGSARLNIRDASQQLIEFQYSSNSIGTITSFAGIPGLRFNGGSGVNQFVLSSTGNIGIGTTSPSVKLQVEDGSIILGDSTYISTSIPSAPGNLGVPNDYRLFFDNTINQTAGTGMPANKIVLHNNNWTAGFGVESQSVTYHSGYSHTFYGNATNTSTYGNATMMIRGDGNVGISTTNPVTNLHINGPGLQLGTSTNAFYLSNTVGNLHMYTGSWNSGTHIASFISSGNIGLSTSTPAYTLDINGSLRASGGMLLSSSNVFEFGHGISGKNSDAGKIGYNTWTAGLNIIGAGTTVGNRLVYIYDNLQVGTSVTMPNIRITGTTNITGNATVQATTNNYTLTSGSLNVTGDIILSGTELMFTNNGFGAPTMNGRGGGSKIVLFPQTNITQGDFSIGIDTGIMWFQVPSAVLGHGYRFYQGTSANVVIGTNGNLGIGTLTPQTTLSVNGASHFLNNFNGAFTSFSGLNTGAGASGLVIGWNGLPSTLGEVDFISYPGLGTGGFNFALGNSVGNVYNNSTMRITSQGNIGINTTTPIQTLDVNGNIALSNLNSGKMFVGNATTGSARLNIRDLSQRLIEFQYATSSVGNITCFTNGPGLLLNGGGGVNQLVLAANGNVGIGTTSPQAKLHVLGNSGNNIFEGTDHVYLQFYPFGYSAGRKTWVGFGNSNLKDFTIYNEATSGAVILNNAAGGSIRFINDSTTAMTITGGNVGIGTASPAYLLDVNGTIDALTVTTGNLSNGTATIGTLLNTTLINYGVSAQWTLTGGGVTTFNGSSLLWSARIIVLPVKITEYSSNGYIDINCPTSGTITFYNASNVTTTVTCTASGVPLGAWQALYYEVTPGQSATSDQTKFRLVDFSNTTWKPTSNWLLIAVRNGDSTSVKWIAGNAYIPSGGTFNNYTIFNSSGVIGIGTTQPATGFSTAIPNARLSILSGASGSNNGTSRISIGGDNSHYAAIEGGHTISGATTLALMTCLNASTNSGNPLTRMFITASGDIGIGSTVPSYRLDVNGAGGFRGNAYVNFAGAGSTPQLQVSPNSNGAEASIGFWQNAANSGALWVIGHNPGSAGSDEFAIYSSTLGRNTLTIHNNGNIGIDNNSPGAKLHLVETSGTAAGANSGSIILDHENNGGASSITFRSKVNRSSDYAYIQYQDAASVGGGGEASRFIIGVQNDGEDHIILDPSGSVGIGTYSPGFKLQVNGNMRADNIYNNGWFRNYGDQGLYNEDYGCHFYRNDVQYGNWRIHGNAVNNWNGLRFTQAEISLMAGEGATRTCGFHYNNVGWGMMLDSGRNLFVPGNITAYWSDRRLKTNLQQLSHFDKVLSSLTGYSFNWNEKGQEILQKPSDETEIGLIAQDVQAVIPQAVRINKAGQKLDDPDPFEYLTINYDKIIPFLIEGYKAQKSEIQDLHTKVECLEKLIEQLLNK